MPPAAQVDARVVLPTLRGVGVERGDGKREEEEG
jgi:hypothetical protein